MHGLIRECSHLVEAGHVLEEDSLPAVEVGAKGEVHVFHSRARIPAAHVLNALVAPHARGAIEVEEPA